MSRERRFGKGEIPQFTILTPCSQEWESMAGDNAKRFCEHCSRSVFDLTQATDGQIAKLIEDNDGKVCGRLERPAEPVKSTDGVSSRRKSLAYQFSIANLMVAAAFCASVFASLPWIGRQLQPILDRWRKPPLNQQAILGAVQINVPGQVMVGEIEIIEDFGELEE